MKNKTYIPVLEVKPEQKKIAKEQLKKATKDIIITKYDKKTTYNEQGDMIIKRIPIKVNITQKVNETAKLIKEQTATEKLAELEKIFAK